MTDAIVELLAASPVFQHVPPVNLQPAAKLFSLKHLTRGEVLFTADEPADELGIIVDGNEGSTRARGLKRAGTQIGLALLRA